MREQNNPWVENNVPIREEVPAPSHPPRIGITRPQRGLVFDGETIYRSDPWPDEVCVLGVHGGAGETTLSKLAGVRPANHCWHPDAGHLLVTRSNARGLVSAQNVVRQWAAGNIPGILLGLVVMADIPSKLPKELRREFAKLEGAVPHLWYIGFLPELRISDEVSELPKKVSSTLEDIDEKTQEMMQRIEQ